MVNSISILEILKNIELRAPADTAETWDNVGLIAGDPNWKTKGAVVTVDLTEDALDLARRKRFHLIVTHHPPIFPKNLGLRTVCPSGGNSELIFRAIREGIAIITSHTNFDRCALEVVDQVAQGLGASPHGRLLEKSRGSLLKLVTYVPRNHLDAVRTAINAAGAGHIGNYTDCTFSVPGTGTFRGSAETKPFLGNPGILEKADEVRLETVLPRGMESIVLNALFQAHPYEEVAYDLYPIEQGPASTGMVKGLGYGFWGDFPRAKSFSDVFRSVKSLFKTHGFWVTEPLHAGKAKAVRRIGFVAGKGASFMESAARSGCDLFITGEAGYHAALDSSKRGMAVVELGHRGSEIFFTTTMAKWLKEFTLSSVRLDRPTQRIWSGGRT